MQDIQFRPHMLLQLALAVFFRLAGPQFVELIRHLASFGESSSKSHTGAGGARDQPLPLVKDVAFDEADDFAGTNYSRIMDQRSHSLGSAR